MKFEKLYKKNTSHGLEEWQVMVVTNRVSGETFVTMVYGGVDGKKITKSEQITKGKNIGKKNETSIIQQAELEAQAKWEKKLKSGYVKNIQDALAGKLDSSIKGGILPMLAEKFEDVKSIEYPVLVQPKLDGMRCIAHKKDGKVTLWSRTRKPILSCPHIIKAVEAVLADFSVEMFLDGELYTHKFHKDFEKIMSAVRKNHPTPEAEEIQFHVYDGNIVSDWKATFERRLDFINELSDWQESICFVPTHPIHTEQGVKKFHEVFVEAGYEGLMIRNPESIYEHKRSKNLIKYKAYMDDEFDIVNVVKGKDNTVMFVCKMPNSDQTFEATMNGDKKQNQQYLKRSVLWTGKKLNVQFLGYTGKNKVPRSPQGKYIREEE